MSFVMVKSVRIFFLIVGFAFVIIFHEMGHFLACKNFNVPTPVFSIGFGPALLQFKIGATVFQLATIPLGGYVSIDSTQLSKKSYWQKMIITLAGIINNILLSFIILFLLLLINRAKPITKVANVMPNSPAQKSGIEKNDIITHVNDICLNGSIDLLVKTLVSCPNKTIELTVNRSHETLVKSIDLTQSLMMGCSIGYLGIVFASEYSQKKSLVQTIQEAFHATQTLIIEYIFVLINLFTSLKIESISTSLHIIALLNQKLQTPALGILFFIAVASVQLGIFNLMPIPMLDGGQAFIYTLQFLTFYRVSLDNLAVLHYLLLMSIIGYSFYLRKKENLESE